MSAIFSDRFYVNDFYDFTLKIENETFTLVSESEKDLSFQPIIYEKIKYLFEGLRNLESTTSKKMIVELNEKGYDSYHYFIKHLNIQLKIIKPSDPFISTDQLLQIMKPIKNRVFSSELNGIFDFKVNPCISTKSLFFKEFIIKNHIASELVKLNSSYHSLILKDPETFFSLFSSTIINKTILILDSLSADTYSLINFLQKLAQNHPSAKLKQAIVNKIQIIMERQSEKMSVCHYDNFLKNNVEILFQFDEQKAFKLFNKISEDSIKDLTLCHFSEKKIYSSLNEALDLAKKVSNHYDKERIFSKIFLAKFSKDPTLDLNIFEEFPEMSDFSKSHFYLELLRTGIAVNSPQIHNIFQKIIRKSDKILAFGYLFQAKRFDLIEKYYQEILTFIGIKFTDPHESHSFIEMIKIIASCELKEALKIFNFIKANKLISNSDPNLCKIYLIFAEAENNIELKEEFVQKSIEIAKNFTDRKIELVCDAIRIQAQYNIKNALKSVQLITSYEFKILAFCHIFKAQMNSNLTLAISIFYQIKEMIDNEKSILNKSNALLQIICFFEIGKDIYTEEEIIKKLEII